MLVLSAALAGCSGGEGPLPLGGAPSGRASALGTGGAATGLETGYEQVVAKVLPSVVQIVTDQGEGSGVVFDNAGNIVTNAHVVAGAKEFEVFPSSGGPGLPATLVGSFTAGDLAVVRVDDAGLPAATFGESSRLKVGQLVLAMGSPLGLSGSVTNGIVSATGRTVSSRQEGSFPGATISNAVQTSAAINPGNSGGALATMDGGVIGIPTLSAGTSDGAASGIGFAIPSDTVKNIAPQLISSGKVTNSGRAALGVTIAQTVNISSGEQDGVAVVAVTPGGAAEQAGIKTGDVITAVDGQATDSTTGLAEILAERQVGQTVPVEIRRDGETRTVNVKLGELPGS
ncbi:S1-C subfamily serine protease [Actinocorallia herbida]|uniref:S1-C subfamily serine protease n=1 Tax=Actinocorallia herbida TaxID=58109 RepID=A0A3N1CRK3_9ACTN|nr:S1-C subfamily serine protease [Actinocorallia herbida]